MASFESVLLILFLSPVITVNSMCDGETGPSGHVNCISLSGYNKKQWGTCVTNVYMLRKSKGEHQCADEGRTYCYYQCMLERFHSESGDVSDKCACKHSLTPRKPQHDPTAPFLPVDCFSPNGSSCHWYKDCLERKYPCQGTVAEYALTYATKFCDLYTKRKDKFSRVGQHWIDAVRRCLQLDLVPFIRPFANATCQEIHDHAFTSYIPCYLKPYPDTPSICDLSKLDWVRVFWTMKSSFPSSIATAYAPLQSALDTFNGCHVDSVVNNLEQFYRQLQLTIDLIQTSWNTQINLMKDELDPIAIDIAHRIAELLSLSSKQWGWYAYGVLFSTQRITGSIGHKQIAIELLVADLHAINDDVLVSVVKRTNIQLDEIVKKLENALLNGDLYLQTDNGTFYASQMNHCLDAKCRMISGSLLAPVFAVKNDAGNGCSFSIVFVLPLAWIFLR